MKMNVYYLAFFSLFLFSCNNDGAESFELELKRLDTLFISNPSNVPFEDYANDYGDFWQICLISCEFGEITRHCENRRGTIRKCEEL